MEYNLVKGLVTHVTDPSNFWMRIGTERDMSLFDEYQQRLNNHYNKDLDKYMCTIEEFQPGFFTVVAVSQGNHLEEASEKDACYHWERAQVTRVMSNTTADVFFVDLGYTAIVELNMCRIIPEGLFHYLPPQAYRASLVGIKPLSSSWTSKATDFMLKETLDQQVITLLVHYDETGGSYGVVIYTKQANGMWRSLVHEMQCKELGLGTGLKADQFLTDYKVNEWLQKVEEHQVFQLETEEKTKYREQDKNDLTMAAADVDGPDEEWVEEDGASTSDYFLEPLQNTANNDKCKEINASKSTVVSEFDICTLMRGCSVSVSKIQDDKLFEFQNQNNIKMERGLQRLESVPSHHDDQDWDTAPDTAFHSDIVSQIHHGSRERQYSEDDLSDILNENYTERNVAPKRFEELKESPDVDKNDNCKEANDIMEEGNKSNVLPLSEEDSYFLEKKIKEILVNHEEKESDFICASIYSVVEPDADASQDHLQVVICAILEHILQNSCQHTEIPFAILEAYSDAHDFGNAMIVVIDSLKTRFVRLSQSLHMKDGHKKFALILALLFKQAEDWDASVCKCVQDHVMNLVERWTIFNKQRHHSGEELDRSEILYLETVESFLDHSFEIVNLHYGERLELLMEEARFKLLQEGTCRSVRCFLLDMILAFHSGHFGRNKLTVSTASQTDNDMFDPISTADAREGELICEHAANLEIDTFHIENKALFGIDNTAPVYQDAKSFTTCTSIKENLDISERLKRKDIPKSIKNLPPRLFQKCLLDNPTINCSPSDQAKNSDIPHFDLPTKLSSPIPDISIQQSPASGNNSSMVPSGNKFGSIRTSSPNSDIKTCQSEKNCPVEQENSIPVSFSPVLNPVNQVAEYTCPLLSNETLEISEPISVDQKIKSEDLLGLSVDDKASPLSSDLNLHNSVDRDCLESNLKTSKDKHLVYDYTNTVIYNCETKTKIRYTPQELRALNPFLDQPKLPLWDLWEPKEVLEKMIERIDPKVTDIEEDYRSFKRSRSNKSKLNPTAEEFSFPVSSHNKSDEVVNGSSVDPIAIGGDGDAIKLSNSKFSDVFVENSNINTSKNQSNESTLFGIASELLAPNSQHLDKTTGETWGDDTAESASGDFLKSQRSSSTMSRKSKKKRTRGRPLDEFILEQQLLSTSVEDDTNEETLFSEEALQMYEEMERQGIGIDAEVEGAQVLMPAKIGSHILSSSKTPSLFASYRSDQTGNKSTQPWCPGKRFCTNCGSYDHVVYDCKALTSRLLL